MLGFIENLDFLSQDDYFSLKDLKDSDFISNGIFERQKDRFISCIRVQKDLKDSDFIGIKYVDMLFEVNIKLKNEKSIKMTCGICCL